MESDSAASDAVLLLAFYVPVKSCEAVKNALFAAGAGRIGAYDACCWQTAGRGQFRALAGSQPTIGEPGVVQTVAEMKVEMLCAADCVAAVSQALHLAHPYETPAYHWCAVQAPLTV